MSVWPSDLKQGRDEGAKVHSIEVTQNTEENFLFFQSLSEKWEVSHTKEFN